MKFSPLLLFFVFTACSYKIVKNYEISDFNSEQNSTELVGVSKKKDLYGLNSVYLGTIKLDDSGTTINCSYDNAMEILQEEARLLDANLINIVDYKFTGLGGSSCYRCIAEFHRISFSSLDSSVLLANNREVINLDSTTTLNWNDFLIEMADTANHSYEFVSSLRLSSGSRSFWDGAFKELSATPILYIDISKVRKGFNNKAVLNTLISINKLHASILTYKALNHKRTWDERKLQKLVDQQSVEMVKMMGQYSQESEEGKNKESQQLWLEEIDSTTQYYNILITEYNKK